MFKNLFSRPTGNGKNSGSIYIVSGLPRSGTSMMMKMLAEGGLPIATDFLRQADEDNPNGYYELEAVKQLKDGNGKWLQESQGKVLKVISYLLEYLPPKYEYRILFMERDINEILASQKKMLERRNQANEMSDELMAQQYQEHLNSVKYWLPRQPNMQVQYVSHRTLIDDPQKVCQAIVDFLKIPLDVNAMLEVPDPSLYRNRVRS